jgi:2,4-dienoyl-CoA reductase-like NADH-dependent reductase (Old Yellow Enzyme family)
VLFKNAVLFDPSNLTAHGIPSDSLINLYHKWGHSQFGLIVTGNVLLDHRHLEAAGNVILSEETKSSKKTKQLKKMAEAAKSDGALAVVQ